MKERIVTKNDSEEASYLGADKVNNLNYFTFFEYAPIALWIEDFSDIKNAIEKKLAELNTNISTLFIEHPEIVYDLASLVKIKDVNSKAVELCKAKNKKDLLGNLNVVFTEKSNEGFSKLLVDILNGKKETEIESVNRTLEGEEFDTLVRFKVAKGSEQTLENIIISVEDITEKVKIRNKLVSNERKFIEVYNIVNKSASVAILCKNDYDFPVIFASENCSELFGFSPEEFLSGAIKIHELVHHKDLANIRNQVFELVKSKNQTTIKLKPYRIITKSNTIKWVRANIDVIRNSKDKITNIQGIVEDITEQKRAEDLLFKSSQQLKDQFNHTPLASIIWDLNFKVLEWNPSAERIFGYSANEAIGKSAGDLILTDEIFEEVKLVKDDLISEKGGNRNTNKNRTKSGKIIICDWYNVTLKDSSGNVTGMASLTEDVTERKRIEELLFESNQKLKHQFNNTPLASIIWDLDFNILEWNNSAERIFGYSAEEVIGKPNRDLLTPPHLLEEMEKLRKSSFVQNESFRQTNENITKNGDIIICDWYSVTLKDSKNNVFGAACLVDDITERIKARKLLEKSEKKYKDIFEKSIDSVIILKNGFLVDCNESTLKMFGYDSKESVLNLHPSQISPKYQKDGGESIELADQIMQVALQKGFNRFRWNHQRKNGEVFPAEVTLTKIEDIDNSITIHAVVTDITDSVKKEELENVLYNISKAASTIDDFNEFSLYIKNELHKIIDTTNFYIGLYDETTDMIKMPIMVDEKEDLIEFPAEKSLTGYVIKSNKPLMVTNKQHKQLITDGIVDMVGEESKIWVGVPLKIQDKAIGAIAVQSYNNENAYHQDDLQLLEFVADQISSSIQRKNTEVELRKVLLKAQESDKLKSAFLANMSHEIRTPMNGIIGFSELSLDSNLSDSDRKRYANIVVNSSKQLLTIVNDILDISKIEAGVVKLNYDSICINHLMDDLYDFYKQTASDNYLKFTCKKGLDSRKSIIDIDGPKLNQVLINLLSNSFKFTNEGGIEFGYELKNDTTIQFFVKDTGIGIDKELHEVIFDRFMQANLNLKKQSKGTGLGLAISKKFIELFQGEIWIESDESGTSVYFTIPYNKSSEKPITTVIDFKTSQTPIEDMELTILIAEDEEYNMLYMTELFANTKIKVIEAYNGKEAVELVKSREDIDLIFMDIKMPVMNGIEALDLIKKIKPKIPIIALSAFAMESDKVSALKNGFDEYLSKPIDRKKLVALLSKYATKKLI